MVVVIVHAHLCVCLFVCVCIPVHVSACVTVHVQLKKKYRRVTDHLRDKITVLQATNQELDIEKQALQYVLLD